jgi:hypothetical protein
LGFETLGFETFGFETIVFDGFDFLLDFLAGRGSLVWALDLTLDLAFADLFGTDRTRAFLARWARMIFAMNGIY